MADLEAVKVDVVTAVGIGTQADRQGGKGSADDVATASDHDVSGGFDVVDEPVGRVRWFAQSRKPSLAWPVDLGRSFEVAVRFVGSASIEVVVPGSQRPDLTLACSLPGDLSLEHSVDVFVCVVIRTALAIHELNADAQPMPPQA